MVYGKPAVQEHARAPRCNHSRGPLRRQKPFAESVKLPDQLHLEYLSQSRHVLLRLGALGLERQVASLERQVVSLSGDGACLLLLRALPLDLV